MKAAFGLRAAFFLAGFFAAAFLVAFLAGFFAAGFFAAGFLAAFFFVAIFLSFELLTGFQYYHTKYRVFLYPIPKEKTFFPSEYSHFSLGKTNAGINSS
ncbi:MAG TPA: hypothetical protein VFV31_05575 [Chitinophagaceae bacterium]|nr:hypothetical protein [Chitinophagaceae bacterium]